MDRRRFLRTSSSLLAATALSKRVCSQPKKKNVIFFLVDDLGWTDVTCFGSTLYETPAIDRMASQGMRFTQAYSACTVCSPTRASILTGKYPATVRITDWIAGHKRPYAKLKVPDFNLQLPHDEITLAEVLKANGYTCASIGKWHLGGEGHLPETQGFDLNVAGTERGQPPSYFAPYKIPTLDEGGEGEYLTDRMAAEASSFIENNKDRPFFLYLPFFTVHTPIQGKKEYTEKYQEKIKPGQKQKNPEYAAMVQSLDEAVNAVLSKLDELGLAEDTIVIFTGDNGGLMRVTDNSPLREGKGSAYEGGVRVPLIVRCPGVVEPGSECDTPVISPDYFPTILNLLGVQDDPNHQSEGEDLTPLLTQSGEIERDAMYWHYPHYHPGGATPYSAIRIGDLKLIKFYENGNKELYNLKDDISEANDLASSMPDKVSELDGKLVAWLTKIDAQMPEPNPDYDPDK